MAGGLSYPEPDPAGSHRRVLGLPGTGPATLDARRSPGSETTPPPGGGGLTDREWETRSRTRCPGLLGQFAAGIRRMNSA